MELDLAIGNLAEVKATGRRLRHRGRVVSTAVVVRVSLQVATAKWERGKGFDGLLT